MQNDDLSAVASLAGVKKRLGSKTVLDGLDLAVRAGEVTALLGPNGAGKSTSVGLLTGRLLPDAGIVQLFGLDPSRPAARGRMGVMLQSAGLPDTLSVAEMVQLQSGYYHQPRPLAETLALAGLTDLGERRCGTLSGGQARRVHYALAICGNPDLLVLDEPTAGLDREARLTLWDTVRAAADSGTAVLLTSHDMAEADSLADRVLLMDGSRILTDASPVALRARLGGSTITCRTRLEAPRLAALPKARGVERAGAGMRIQTADAPATLSALLGADPGLADLRVTDSALEDAIAGLLRADERVAA